MVLQNNLLKNAVKGVAVTIASVILSLGLALVPAETAKADVTAGQAIAMGIDVSSYQGLIDWNQVKASGVKFAFIRIATSRGIDKYYDINIRGAQAAGIPVGVYLYSYATTPEEVAAEAALVCTLLEPYPIQLPVVFDIESDAQKNLGAAMNQALCNTWCAVVDSFGYYPMVYSGRNYFVNNIGDMLWDKWIAHYHDKCVFPFSQSFWQASCTGRVAGIAGNVDVDYQYKDYSKLIINTGFLPRGTTFRYYRNYKMVKGWFVHEGQKYVTDEFGNLAMGIFVSDGVGMCFLDPKDGHAVTGSVDIAGSKFLFDADSHIMVGKQVVGDATYYYDPALGGAQARNGLVTSQEGYVYFAGTDGKLQSGFVDINGGKYLFDPTSKAMLTGTQTVMGTDFVIIEDTGLCHVVPLADLAAVGLSVETLTPDVIALLMTMY